MTCQIICVSSGKGGVGKTSGVCLLGASVLASGKKVLILDGDMGMSNIPILLGMTPDSDLSHVIEGSKDIKDVILSTESGLDVVASGSGIFALQNMSLAKRYLLRDILFDFKKTYDWILIDTGAGIGDNVLFLNQLSDLSLIVTTPEPHAMADAYALIKVLSEKGQKNFFVIVNMAKDQKVGSDVFFRMNSVAKKFLEVHLEYLGFIPYDESLERAILQRKIVSNKTFRTISGQAWNQVGRKFLLKDIHPENNLSYTGREIVFRTFR